MWSATGVRTIVHVDVTVERVWVGSLADLRTIGHLVAKVGAHGVLVIWQEGRAHAIDDRCPHMGFPLHRGTVEEGLVTCHWHHAGIDRLGAEFGIAYRREGWGAGLTVLTAMANLLPHLAPEDRPLALVHGLAFVSRDTAGHAPRFGLEPLGGDVDDERLVAWFRRFVDTRSSDAAERTLLTAIDRGSPPAGGAP